MMYECVCVFTQRERERERLRKSCHSSLVDICGRNKLHYYNITQPQEMIVVVVVITILLLLLLLVLLLFLLYLGFAPSENFAQMMESKVQ